MAKRSSSKGLHRKQLFALVAIVLVIAIVLGVLWYTGYLDTVLDLLNIGGNKDENNDGGANPTRYDGTLTVYFVDVGQGDCILICLPDGKEMLIDSGNTTGGSVIGNRTITYLSSVVTDNQIDYLMLTHCDSDHCYYLDEVLEAFDVDNIYMPDVLAEPSNTTLSAQVDALDATKLAMFTDEDTIETACYANFFIDALSEEGANIHLNVGEFNLDTDTYSFDFYCYSESEWDATDLSSAEEKNAISPIGVLEYNGRRIVFTGDSNELNEDDFISAVGGTTYDCDVLKVGHHGSQTSSTTEFLNFVKCEYAVISCGEGNSHEHPRQATLDRLKGQTDSDAELEVYVTENLYRTDLQGNIVMTVNANGDIAFTTQTTADATALWVGADAE